MSEETFLIGSFPRETSPPLIHPSEGDSFLPAPLMVTSFMEGPKRTQAIITRNNTTACA